MDLGLGNLIELKRHLLSTELATRTTWDIQATAIGKGVAKLFDKFCNRKFARLAGAVEQFSADRASWIMERYPVETITSVDLRSGMGTGFVSLGDVNSILINRDDGAGLIHFGCVQGIYQDQVRVTYTGGYWYDTTEDATGVMPSGATALPDDVKEAWFLQCLKFWETQDPVGGAPQLGLLGHNTDIRLANLGLVPAVQAMLAGHKRMNLT